MSLTMFEDNHEFDEETPFLPNQEGLSHLNPTRTPLPIAQISVLLTAWLAESITSQSISPYLNQLVRELPNVDGDARKVGYYTGIIVSLHYAAEAATSFQWNRLSDHVGRKPVLLSCLVGTTLSILLFGLSRSFWALALSRCFHGAMKGHIGAVRSIIAELTDETNIARGFSLPPVAWSLGFVIGPLIGGVLSRPQERWPQIFSHPFWANYPYFLPCLLAATFTCLSFVITGLYLEETLDSRSSERLQLARVNSDAPQGEADAIPILGMKPNELDKPLPLRSVLTKPVVVTVANYAMLALLDAAVMSYIPLVWSTPVEYGGLNLNPTSIGLWLSLYGVMDGIFQFVFFSHFISRFGPRRVFVFSIVSCAVIYATFPFESLAVVAGGGPNLVVWLLIILQLSSLCIFDMGFATMYMYISSAAPNKRSLGAAFGLSQVATSVQYAVGPAAADWLFAFSLTHNVLGGDFAYVVLVGVACVALGVSTQLPRNTWAHRKE
ncbi:MFS general substrate transporter [Lactarius psammicola]|nr:MFS general substrate transporter [Lactarius psammicola]